jgi:hypothetical protein
VKYNENLDFSPVRPRSRHEIERQINRSDPKFVSRQINKFFGGSTNFDPSNNGKRYPLREFRMGQNVYNKSNYYPDNHQLFRPEAPGPKPRQGASGLA